jgi:hypothetical protein
LIINKPDLKRMGNHIDRNSDQAGQLFTLGDCPPDLSPNSAEFDGREGEDRQRNQAMAQKGANDCKIGLVKERKGSEEKTDMTGLWNKKEPTGLGESLKIGSTFEQTSVDHSYKYKGEMKDGKKHGFGVLESQTARRRFVGFNDRYTGHWECDKLHGFVKEETAAFIYEGEYAYGEKDGLGSYLLSNGDRYEGELRLGRLHGLGRYLWLDGTEYFGEFHEGRLEGKGVLIVTLNCEKYLVKGLFKAGSIVCRQV